MTLKEKKIKEVYLGLFKPYENKEERYFRIEYAITEDGWFCGSLNDVESSSFDVAGDYIRPISLRGIADNNGWIIIESETDLPNDENIDHNYQNRYRGGKFANDNSFCHTLKDGNYQDVQIMHKNGLISHYQIIEIINPVY